MARSKRARQGKITAQKLITTGQAAPKRTGVLVACAMGAALAVAGLGFWAARHFANDASHEIALAGALSDPAKAASVDSSRFYRIETNLASAEPTSMGSVPSQGFLPGSMAVNSKSPQAGERSASQLPLGFEGPIKLDPICDSIAARIPRFAPGNPAPSTRRMAARLAEIYEKTDPMAAGYMNDRLVTMLEEKVASATAVNEKLQLQFALGLHQINASQPDAALNTFFSLEHLVSDRGGELDKRVTAELRVRKAMAFLRLGEQENCLAQHNADSCIFPLSAKAQHILPRGSRGAVALFSEHLADYPNDYTARWLLNLAHMTLGEYPNKVKPEHLIPPKAFQSDYAMPRFPDVSEGLGLDANDLAGGVIVDDFDNDGLYDVVISAWDHRGQLRYFRNSGDGTFKERTSEAGLVGEVGSLNIQQTDYNNDGWLDIWMLRGGWLGKSGRIPNSLLRNNGDGTFTDVTEEAGLLSFHPTQASRWADFDGDGWLDLFIGNETTDVNEPERCQLYRNNRNGTFTECAEAAGIRIAAFIKGVACADYDNDGRPDLSLSIRGQSQKVLLHNDGPDSTGQLRFSNVAAKAGVDKPIRSFATFFFDYDNDGWEDLLVLGYYYPDGVGEVAKDYVGLPNRAEKPILYHNNRDGTFTDVTVAARLNRVTHAMGHNYGDLDNDGWLDFYCGTGDPDFTTLIPNRMFRNSGGKFFQDVTTATGTGHIQKGHGVSFADFDDDGDQDVYSALGGAYSGDLARNALFMNPGFTNQWLKLKLVGTKANRPAIGARIKVTLQTPTGTRELHRTVSSGGNFGSNPLRQEIGLGDATMVTSVEIRWPGSNTRQSLNGLKPNHSYEIREGNSAPLALKLHPVKLDKSAHTSHTAMLK